MRSRYSAYALDLDAYVLETWAPDKTRPAVLFEDGEDRPKWLSLSSFTPLTRKGRRAESASPRAAGPLRAPSGWRRTAASVLRTADGYMSTARLTTGKISTYEPPFGAGLIFIQQHLFTEPDFSCLSIPGTGASPWRRCWTGQTGTAGTFTGCSRAGLASTPKMVTTGAIIHGDRDRLLGFSQPEHPVCTAAGRLGILPIWRRSRPNCISLRL